MRTLTLLLLLTIPVAAGEQSPLEAAVKKFKSDEAAERDAATQRVRNILKKELAPLLEALESDDPEVARRARQALEALLPAPKKNPQAAQPGNGKVTWVAFGPQNQRALRVVVQNGNQFKIVPQQPVRPIRIVPGFNPLLTQKVELRKFGVEGHALGNDVARKKLAVKTGFVVDKVLSRTVAARLGLKARDVVLSVGGKAVNDAAQLLKALGGHAGWKRAKLEILRAGKKLQLSAK